MKRKIIPRDISWLSFNARVLQEAADPSNPLRERVKFLGIFSNNLDEFFRVRVATLNRMLEFTGKGKLNMHMEVAPEKILDRIQTILRDQQENFDRIWEGISAEMRKEKIFLVNEKDLSKDQQKFVQNYFEEEARANIIPLMVQSIPQFPYLREKSLYLGVVLTRRNPVPEKRFAIIEIPSRVLGRFVVLPSPEGESHIMLLEDVIRFNLRSIFSYFGFDRYGSWVFKVTRDAEIDIDSDIATPIIEKIEKGVKNRRKGKYVRFVYDKEMDGDLLAFLIKGLSIGKRGSIIPGGRIHNFRHFMDFPDVFPRKGQRRKPFPHPSLKSVKRVTDVVFEQDIMLHFPYHSFNPVIDMLREAAIDPDVTSIKITCYRLAPHSKVINALVNAVRNGKNVTVMMELRARFDEEANIEWRNILVEEGVRVIDIIPNMKVHAKLCLIRKKIGNRSLHYGFVSTGNLNERTATIYGDHCLLTANRNIAADMNRIFNYLEKWQLGARPLRACKTLIPCPDILRNELSRMINREIRTAREGGHAAITLKVNSLSDEQLIGKLYQAALAGVEIKMIIRSICCMMPDSRKFPVPVMALSILDEYLEHARVIIFHNGGKEKVYLSSADWMVRNLDHRVEATCPVLDENIIRELKDILNIQLADNVKARWLDNHLTNTYKRDQSKKTRSQIEIYNYLFQKNIRPSETPEPPKPADAPQTIPA